MEEESSGLTTAQSCWEEGRHSEKDEKCPKLNQELSHHSSHQHGNKDLEVWTWWSLTSKFCGTEHDRGKDQTTLWPLGHCLKGYWFQVIWLYIWLHSFTWKTAEQFVFSSKHSCGYASLSDEGLSSCHCEYWRHQKMAFMDTYCYVYPHASISSQLICILAVSLTKQWQMFNSCSEKQRKNK